MDFHVFETTVQLYPLSVLPRNRNIRIPGYFTDCLPQILLQGGEMNQMNVEGIADSPPGANVFPVRPERVPVAIKPLSEMLRDGRGGASIGGPILPGDLRADRNGPNVQASSETASVMRSSRDFKRNCRIDPAVDPACTDSGRIGMANNLY